MKKLIKFVQCPPRDSSTWSNNNAIHLDIVQYSLIHCLWKSSTRSYVRQFNTVETIKTSQFSSNMGVETVGAGGVALRPTCFMKQRVSLFLPKLTPDLIEHVPPL